ncbi:MAG: ABC-F family ATP-binding cassette domain-containing protein [Armatimonadetes bacterium]|nr:ABC-F family ATP-binding cassette domain-containing protein [Armatimonadota bacterium]
MALLSVSDIHKAFGADDILRGAAFQINAGEKAALVGANGSGKTTLLRLIARLDEADGGSVNLSGGCRIGYLPQDTLMVGGHTLYQEAYTAREAIVQVERELHEVESRMADAPEEEMEALTERYSRLYHEYERLEGFSYEAAVKATLGGLGFAPQDFEKSVAVLSGGQKTRAALAKLLLQEPDLLLLDEPTNHLDIEATEWLEEFLSKFKGAALIVSHDRYFLDRLVSKVVELADGRTETYPGNYNSFLKLREMKLHQRQEEWERQQEEIAKLEDYIRRYKAGNRATMAKSREKMLARIQPIHRPREQRTLKAAVAPASGSGRIVAEIKGLSMGYGPRTLFENANLTVEREDKIGLVGPNGSGKTTLLKIVLGEETPLAGQVRLGHNVEIGYFAQDLGGLDPENNLVDEILEVAPQMTPAEVRHLLARYLFSGEDVFKRVGDLSGGERNRVVLAKLLVQQPNFLLLDEPTNHLDIPSREALEQALHSYTGTVLFSSHDRYLLDTIATRIVEVAAGGVTVYEGNYSEYRARKARLERRAASAEKSAVQRATSQPAPSSASSRAALQGVEKEIAETEVRLSELSLLLSEEHLYQDGVRVAESVKEYETLTTRLESLYQDWEILALQMEN